MPDTTRESPRTTPWRRAPGLLAVSLAAWVLCSHPESAQPPPSAPTLVAARDLAQLGERSRRENVPILLSVSQDHCPFCQRLKEDILRPMLISGDYEHRVLIRELSIDPGETVRDFAGDETPARVFAESYKVWVTPTLLFLGPDGRELSPRILGINTVEMFGYYVDEAIDDALGRMRVGEAAGYEPTPADIGAWPLDWDDVSR